MLHAQTQTQARDPRESEATAADATVSSTQEDVWWQIDASKWLLRPLWCEAEVHPPKSEAEVQTQARKRSK